MRHRASRANERVSSKNGYEKFKRKCVRCTVETARLRPGSSRNIGHLNAARAGLRILEGRFQPAEREQIAGLERVLLDQLAINKGAITRPQVGQPDLLLAVAEPCVLA